MKFASDFRQIARDALRGRWGVAVLAGFIAALLGAVTSGSPNVSFNFSDNGNMNFSIAKQQIFSTSDGWFPELGGILLSVAGFLALVAIVTGIALFILGSIIRVGYARFNLDLVDRRVEPQIPSLFAFFPHWKKAALTSLLTTVYILLWSLLLVIPGIIASYSYAMTGYILAENPELHPSDAIAMSKDMMSGNRLRLFCLEFSFIGWSILAAMTMGIGNLWLTPYKEAAKAAFFREISGTEYRGNPTIIDAA